LVGHVQQSWRLEKGGAAPNRMTLRANVAVPFSAPSDATSPQTNIRTMPLLPELGNALGSLLQRRRAYAAPAITVATFVLSVETLPEP